MGAWAATDITHSGARTRNIGKAAEQRPVECLVLELIAEKIEILHGYRIPIVEDGSLMITNSICFAT
jgi:hypothetical protein